MKGAASKRSKAQNASCTGPLWDRTFAAEFFSHIAKMARHLESFCPVFLRMFPFWYGNSCTFTQGSFPSHRFSRNLLFCFLRNAESRRILGAKVVFFLSLTTKLGMEKGSARRRVSFRNQRERAAKRGLIPKLNARCVTRTLARRERCRRLHNTRYRLGLAYGRLIFSNHFPVIAPGELFGLATPT